MPQLRLALAQIDVTVGDIAGNADEIVRWTRHAADRGAHVVAFPEMALTGYPVEDLALRPSFVAASRAAMDELAARLASEGLGELAVVCGYLDGGSPSNGGGSSRNAVAVLHRGRVVAHSAKHHLPTYGVFDEARYFVPGEALLLARLHGVDVAIVICEDLWQDGGPVAAAGAAGAGLLLVLNGSPYERDKDDVRLELARRRARQAGCALAYVNLVGGQDELVFDGDSLVVGANGDVLTRAPQFTEGLLVVDLELAAATGGMAAATGGMAAAAGATGEMAGAASARLAEHAEISIERADVVGAPLPAYEPLRSGVAPRLEDEAEVYQAIVTGVRDYVRKQGIERVFLMLSGGIDSALVATIAADALGPDRVATVAMPSKHSSEHSLTDAEELARRQGLSYEVVPITELVAAYENALALAGRAAENLQARIRGVIIMAKSNSDEPSIVLATGNKSELSVGYSTIYGDAVGGYAPLKDVPKTMVFRLARWRNRVASERGETPPIPENTIEKPPSAELSPGQLDTDSLPPYDVLDDILDLYVERDAGPSEIIARGFDAETVARVLRLVDGAEYKRRQYPAGPKISFKAYGRDRRLPITNHWRESPPS